MRTFGVGSELMAGELTFVLNGLLREYMAVNGEEGLKLEEDAVCDLIIDCLEAVMERRRDKERMITPQQMRTFQNTLDGEASSIYPNLRKMQLRKELKGAIRDYEQSGEISCLREASALLADRMLAAKSVQGLPVVGVVGGVTNSVMIGQVGRMAGLKYKKRFLNRQNGIK